MSLKFNEQENINQIVFNNSGNDIKCVKYNDQIVWCRPVTINQPSEQYGFSTSRNWYELPQNSGFILREPTENSDPIESTSEYSNTYGTDSGFRWNDNCLIGIEIPRPQYSSSDPKIIMPVPGLPINRNVIIRAMSNFVRLTYYNGDYTVINQYLNPTQAISVSSTGLAMFYGLDLTFSYPEAPYIFRCPLNYPNVVHNSYDTIGIRYSTQYNEFYTSGVVDKSFSTGNDSWQEVEITAKVKNMGTQFNFGLRYRGHYLVIPEGGSILDAQPEYYTIYLTNNQLPALSLREFIYSSRTQTVNLNIDTDAYQDLIITKGVFNNIALPFKRIIMKGPSNSVTAKMDFYCKGDDYATWNDDFTSVTFTLCFKVYDVSAKSNVTGFTGIYWFTAE